MKKLLLLMIMSSLFASCKNEVEIIVTDENGALCVGAMVYVTTEDISDIKTYVDMSRQYWEQREFIINLMGAGLSKEDAEKKAVDHQNKFYKELNHGYPYITEDELDKYRDPYTAQKVQILIVADRQTTNSAGSTIFNLADGDFNIYIEANGYDEYAGSMYIHEKGVKVFKIAKKLF